MYFQTADITVAPWMPPLVAFGISFFTAMGGVSGAFLLLPFQMSFLGYTQPSVSATNQLFNIVAIPSGVWRYCHERRMVWPLAWVVIAGTLPGVVAGALIRVSFLPDPRHFKGVAAAVLLFIGLRLVWDLARKPYTRAPEAADAPPMGRERPVTVLAFNRRHLVYSFDGQTCTISVPAAIGVSLLVGLVGGVYGIGGGAILAPFFIGVFKLPVHTVAGATLMGTFVTSIVGTAFYQAIAPFYPNLSVAPDWMLGLLFGLGGMAGIYLGARCQKYVSARLIKWMLAAIILWTAGSYTIAFMAALSSLFPPFFP